MPQFFRPDWEITESNYRSPTQNARSNVRLRYEWACPYFKATSCQVINAFNHCKYYGPYNILVALEIFSHCVNFFMGGGKIFEVTGEKYRVRGGKTIGGEGRCDMFFFRKIAGTVHKSWVFWLNLSDFTHDLTVLRDPLWIH